MEMNLTWKNVLSSDNKWFGHIDIFANLVRKIGYLYFEWNGRIYRINYDQRDDTPYYITPYKITDIR